MRNDFVWVFGRCVQRPTSSIKRYAREGAEEPRVESVIKEGRPRGAHLMKTCPFAVSDIAAMDICK